MESPAPRSTLMTGSLAAQCPLPVPQAMAVWAQLVTQTQALHRAGRLHGAIQASTILVDRQLQASLPPTPLEITVGQATNDDLTPPECRQIARLRLPSELPLAAQALSRAGLDILPERIDVYQLGVVLCRMLTGETPETYLRSVKLRGRVPVELRAPLDSALGHDPRERSSCCDALVSFCSSWAPVRDPQLTPPPAAAWPKIGPYQLLERIGSGGMGDVYKAYEASLDRTVAIKMLPAELARQSDFVRRFRTEATAVAKLSHPNIVQVYATGEHEGHPYFVMQYVNGESLARLLKRRKKLGVEETLGIAQNVLAGLAEAHAQQFVHRDIKPGNVLIDPMRQQALIADFGLVKSAAESNAQTATGVLLGTIDYLSPEQARGQATDGRSDLYSLGVMLYQMLSGALPFQADSTTGMIFKHAYEQPRALHELAPDVPERLCAIVERLMAKDADERHQTANEVLADLAAFRVGKKLLAPPAARLASPVVVATLVPPEQLSSEPVVAPWWRRWFAPSLPSSSPSNTTIEIDGAIAKYTQRRDELAQLLRDAEQLAAEFTKQVSSLRHAAAEATQRAKLATDAAAIESARHEQQLCEQNAADFARRLEEQKQQIRELQARVSKADATLEQLQAQRAALLSRLRLARARVDDEVGGTPARRWPTALWGVVGCGLAFVLVLGLTFWGSGPRQPKPLVAAPMETPVVQPKPEVKPLTAQPSGNRPPRLPWPFRAEEAREKQIAWAEHLHLPSYKVLNSLGMPLVVVPPGTYLAGTPDNEPGHEQDEGPLHPVVFTKPTLVGAYEVTQKEFHAIMKFNPSTFSPARTNVAQFYKLDGERFPVENVSWFDAILFCNGLSRHENLPEYYSVAGMQYNGKHVIDAEVQIVGGKGYRLPTEAEWEYYARSGTMTPFYTGKEHNGTQGNVQGKEPYGTAQQGPYLGRTTVVGAYAPNAFGLYDMDGNVSEWCWDVYSGGYYPFLAKLRTQEAMSDPRGPASNTPQRIMRGTSWAYSPLYARSGNRHGEASRNTTPWTGIRVVRTLE